MTRRKNIFLITIIVRNDSFVRMNLCLILTTHSFLSVNISIYRLLPNNNKRAYIEVSIQGGSLESTREVPEFLFFCFYNHMILKPFSSLSLSLRYKCDLSYVSI